MAPVALGAVWATFLAVNWNDFRGFSSLFARVLLVLLVSAGCAALWFVLSVPLVLSFHLGIGGHL